MKRIILSYGIVNDLFLSICNLQENSEMFQDLKILPFEVLEDAEVYGQAVSALAETKPLNRGSKVSIDNIHYSFMHTYI